MNAQDVAAALKDRDAAAEDAVQASRRLAEAIRAAREAGTPWKAICDATGLSRQRLWQIVNE